MDASAISGIFNDLAKKLSLTAILWGLIVLVVLLLVKKAIMAGLNRIFKKTTPDEKVRKIILRLINFALTVILVLLVCSSLGLNMSSLVALISVLTLGVSLAMSDILANAAGGLLLLGQKPFTLGEYVEVNGVAGHVYDMRLANTQLKTIDGELVTIPNKEMSSSKIINYTRLGMRRVEVLFGASYDAPTKAVREAALAAAARSEAVLEKPKPQVVLLSYDASNISYALYFWVKPEDYLNVLHAVTELIREEFHKAGVPMSYDHINVHMIAPKEDRE